MKKVLIFGLLGVLIASLVAFFYYQKKPCAHFEWTE